MTSALIRDTERRGGDSVDYRGRDWSDAAISQVPTGATRSWQRQEQILDYSPCKECGLADTLISDLASRAVRQYTSVV